MGFAPIKPDYLPMVRHTDKLKEVHVELLSHNLKVNNFYEYWYARNFTECCNYSLYPDNIENKIDINTDDAIEWYQHPEDDEWTIAYLKLVDDDHTVGQRVEWCQYGMKHYVIFVKSIPPNKYDKQWQTNPMDIQTKVGIELLAKSYYDERTEQKKSIDPTYGMTIAEEEEWIATQLAIAESGEFTSGRLYQL